LRRRASCRRERADRVSRNARYKNYTIRSTPLQHPDSRLWTIGITIDWERNGQVTERPYSTKNTYRTEVEADLHGIAYGQLIIDGQVQVD
jgi:hypothetical protein